MHGTNQNSRKHQNPETSAKQEQIFVLHHVEIPSLGFKRCQIRHTALWRARAVFQGVLLLAIWQESDVSSRKRLLQQSTCVNDLSPMTERDSDCHSAVRQSHPEIPSLV